MTPIPVVYVIARMTIGGAQRHLLDVLARLDRRAFAPALYCLRVGPGDGFVDAVHGLGLELLDGRVAGSLAGPQALVAAVRLAAALRRRRAQVVHAYLFHANVVGPLAARLARVPVALVSKRSLDRYPRAFDRWACRLGNALADRVTANARAVGRHVERVEGCPARKIAVIPNGIDVPRLGAAHRDRAAPSGRPPVVGTVGRLAPKKAQADLLRAAPMVLDQWPDARFLLVGDGPLRGDLERLARETGIGGHVEFLGSVRDPARLLGGLDVFVLPSHVEGMSNGLLEAMAAGLPAVVTDVGGNAEVVVDGETGFVVPARRPELLAAAISTLLKDPERARAMGAAGRARVAAEFTVEAMLARLERLYRDLLAGKGVGRG